MNDPEAASRQTHDSAADSNKAEHVSRFSQDFASALPQYGTPCEREDFPDLKLHIFNEDLATTLDLTAADIEAATTGIAMAYSGHQFGQFNPTMGDGRALLLGEVEASTRQTETTQQTEASEQTKQSHLVDVHLKGSGATPFARRGDGQATLGPMLREYLISEAMHALNVPATRSLGVWTTGKKVLRNKVEQGAMLARTASSHIRVGTFQYGAIKDQGTPEDLLAYAIKRHYPNTPELTPQEFFTRTVEKQAKLLARWMRLGFIHGVMNTDNTAISGETIDYGPCAFMDHFDPRTVFSSIDTQGRYAYAKQPVIIGWNLARLAEALIDAIGIDHAQESMNRFPAIYRQAWLEEMATALGVEDQKDSHTFATLADELIDILTEEKLDLTSVMRWLSEDPADPNNPYNHVIGTATDLHEWMKSWKKLEPNHAYMQQINPIYIPRNHLVEQALKAAEEGNMQPFNELLQHVTNPFTPSNTKPEDDQYRWPAPEEFTEDFRTYCGT